MADTVGATGSDHEPYPELAEGDIAVVEYDERWAAAHSAFARRNWPTKLRRRDPAYQRWKFRGPVAGPVPGFLLAVAGDRVVGQLGQLPGQLWLDGEVLPLQWPCDLMVDPEIRRLGIASMLFHVGLDRPGASLGMEPSAAASKTLEALGMSRCWTSSSLLLTLKAGPAVSGRFPRAKRFDRLVNLAGSPLVRHVNRHLERGARSPEAEVCRWTDVVDLVADHEAAMTDPHAVHDAAFLAWRAAGLDGWVREADALRTPAGSYALVERDDRRLRVLQWHTVDQRDATHLFGRLLYLAEAYGADHVQAYATPAEQAGLVALGFRARRTLVELMCWPAGLVETHSFAFAGYDSDFGL